MNSAIVGCGLISTVHASCIDGMEGHRAVAYADCCIEKAEKHAVQYGGNAYASLEEMLDKEQIDVLHICTPHYLHVPMAAEALRRGINVFMEKPPVINREQWGQLKQAASEGKGKLGFCFQNRYNPTTVKVKELLCQKETGKLLGIRGIVTWNRGSAYYAEGDWRGTLAQEGGGVLINQSVHTLDLIQYFTGKKAEYLDAVMANHHLKGIIEVEDTMSIYIKYPDTTACMYATTAFIADSAPFIELVCENVRIRLEDMDVTKIYADGRHEHIVLPRLKGFGKSYWGAGHAACIADFYDSVEKNRPFGLSIENVENTVELMLDAYEACRKAE